MSYGGSVVPHPTPTDILAALVADDSSRPALTFYDDSPGPSNGERIELSRKVLQNWVAKAANALQEGLDVQPGSVVYLDLPVPHWRYLYWAFAVWSVGATLTLDTNEGADVLVTTDQNAPLVDDADEVVVVSLAALARSYDGDLRAGVMDEAHELSSFGDSFTAWEEPEPTTAALVENGNRIAFAEVVPTSTWPAGSRVLIDTIDASAFLTATLHAFTVSGSVVLPYGGEQQDLPTEHEDRWRAEGVDFALSAGR